MDHDRWAGELPDFLVWLSRCLVFRRVRDHEHRELRLLEDTDPVQGDDSIWTALDVNAYIEAKFRNLTLILLANGRLVSSSM
jgi:hypothetical protein